LLGSVHQSIKLFSLHQSLGLAQEKSATKLAQEMIAKKWGMLDTDKDLEDITLQQYIDIYRKPLSKTAIQAVKELIEMNVMMKKKKRAAQSKAGKSRSNGSTKTSKAEKLKPRSTPKNSKGRKAAAAT
jgi:hypothetical protein